MAVRNDPEETRGDKPSVKVKVKGELNKPVHIVVRPEPKDKDKK